MNGIPGVRKIGPKKAIPMLEKYKNLEGIYENIDSLTEISGVGKALINNLKEDKEIAFMSRELATICQDLDLNFSLENLTYNLDKNRLLELFKVLEFKALIKKLNLENSEINQDEIESNKSIKTLKDRSFKVIEKNADIEVLKKTMKNVKILSIFYSDYGIALSSEENDFYFPFVKKCESKIGANISLFGEPLTVEKNCDTSCEEIQKFFDDYKGKIITYNLKNFLNRGLNIKNCELDLMIAYHLLTSQLRKM